MYKSKLNLVETEIAIKLVKDTFERKLAQNLGLMRVSAPLFVETKSGINDDLNGVEESIKFSPKDDEKTLEIIHSLAKWKRKALKDYGIEVDKGIYTDMNAIRKDETLDHLHSLYVDQWDYEKRIVAGERKISYLKKTVRKIYKAALATQEVLLKKFPQLDRVFFNNLYFIKASELLALYPNLTAKQREREICKKYGSVFIIGIGGKLKNGLPHDGRSPDYDDWKLNGDLLIYYKDLDEAVEIMSMGIRVNKESLVKQLKIAHKTERLELPFHKQLMNDELPLSIGGGIGQSRLCFLMLNKQHIGEVQSSYWPNKMRDELNSKGIFLL